MPASDKNWYSLKKLHLVFAGSAAALFVSTVWMMQADHADEWRGYQTTFDQIQVAQNEQAQAPFKTTQFESQKKELEANRDAALEALKERAGEIGVLEDELEKLTFDFNDAKQVDKTQKAIWNKAKADRGQAIDRGLSGDDLKPFLENVLKEEEQVRLKGVDLEQKEKLLIDKKTILAEITKEKDSAESKIEVLLADLSRLEASKEKLAPSNWISSLKRDVMELPIIDGFNSHHKILQIWLPDLKVPLGMTYSARFDRCITCHKGIDKTLAGNKPTFPHGETESENIADWVAQNKYPHPFATHPNTELFLSSTSPHPMATFGCTVCHDGQGSGTSFTNASHTPNNPHENEKWAHEHHYKSNHFWELPMQPKRFMQSTCLKCHHTVTELGDNPKYGATAPKLVRGFELIKKYGCFGCHEMNGFEGSEQIGPDLRLEPSTAAEAARIAADPSLVAGQMRKVGPSLRYLSQKTTAPFVETWTKEPKAFRPTTKMPQFFDLTNQEDGHAKNMMPVEIAAMTYYLMSKSSKNKVELLEPPKGYKPDVAQGKLLFSQKGCLACHSHKDFPGTTETFGPRLDKVHQKIKPGQAGFKWLYSWIKDPERYHKRTKMPDLFIEPEKAADIAAFLQAGGAGDFKAIDVSDQALKELMELFLNSVLTEAERTKFMSTRKYPFSANDIKGDEIELVSSKEVKLSDAEWKEMQLSYLGRKTISRYGCFGCHDIPGFEQARPIGTALQDWGRKDTSKLALEHITDFLHHHGEADGSSTHARVEKAEKQMQAGGYTDKKREEKEMRIAFFYKSLHHHGRPGFLWQKLRAPRSYDHKKIEAKRYDERLKMPKFPLNEEEIEEIATFVLGLTADPPAEQYLYRPDQRTADRIEGERLLKKYNCVSCHMIDLPQLKYGLPTENPGLDNGLAGLIGMTKNEVIAWLDNNRKKLLAGEKIEIPESVNAVLHNSNEFLGDKLTLPQQAAKLAKLINTKYQDDRRYQQLNALFTKHPAILMVEKLKPSDYPKFVTQMLSMKKPLSGNTNEKFFSINDFAVWLEAIGKPSSKVKNQHQAHLKQLRALGVNTQSLESLAKTIIEGEFDTDNICYFDHILEQETKDVIDDMELKKKQRIELLAFFDKHGEAILLLVDPKTDLTKKKENLHKFVEWITEFAEIAEDDTALKEFAKKQAAKLKADPKGKYLSQAAIKEVADFSIRTSEEDWEFDELEAPDFTDALEEIESYKVIVAKRNEVVKLYHANKSALTQVLGGSVITFSGIPSSYPEVLDDPLVSQVNSYNMWQTLEVGGRLILPAEKRNINVTRLIDSQPARGGHFAQWLVDTLKDSGETKSLEEGWRMAPPPLILEGAKVQNAWLYRFLKEPTQIRYLPVLRMPRFNLSDQEARSLANYFAAVDNVPYPYQSITERDSAYAMQKEAELSSVLKGKGYMNESWNTLTADICIKCHSVGGRKYNSAALKKGEKTPQGPDLFKVQDRLRPEWTQVWLAYPKWFTPYTPMPQNFVRNKKINTNLFNGNADQQMTAVHDALLNYQRMIEAHGKTVPPKVTAPVEK